MPFQRSTAVKPRPFHTDQAAFCVPAVSVPLTCLPYGPTLAITRQPGVFAATLPAVVVAPGDTVVALDRSSKGPPAVTLSAAVPNTAVATMAGATRDPAMRFIAAPAPPDLQRQIACTP